MITNKNRHCESALAGEVIQLSEAVIPAQSCIRQESSLLKKLNLLQTQTVTNTKTKTKTKTKKENENENEN
ncbi:MAG: hypothetical protein ACJA1M_000488 [Alphaproteobacteria bacterium]